MMAAPAPNDRSEPEIEVKVAPADVAPCDTFDAMDFNSLLNQNICGSTYKKPSAVQRYALPVALGGRDLVACARSGSGKMAACVLPALQHAMANQVTSPAPPSPAVLAGAGDGAEEPTTPSRPTALILTPTRELAAGAHAEATKFVDGTGLRCVVLYGGTSPLAQLAELQKGVDVICATPGRLLDLVQRGAISFASVRYVALYEAERMLDMGFEPQLRDMLDNSGMPTKGERQMSIFAAVFSEEVRGFARRSLSNPTFVQVGPGGLNIDTVAQDVRWVEENDKRDMLQQVLLSSAGDQRPTLVYAATKSAVEELQSFVGSLDIAAMSLTADLTQTQRMTALDSFAGGQCSVLITTELPVRGLKFDNAAFVVQYDMASDVATYVRRITRAGTVLNPVMTVTFVNEKNAPDFEGLVAVLEESKQQVPHQLRRAA